LGSNSAALPWQKTFSLSSSTDSGLSDCAAAKYDAPATKSARFCGTCSPFR